MRQPNSRLWLVVPIIFVAWIGQTWAGPQTGESQAETLRWQLLGPPGGEEVFDVDVDPNDPMRIHTASRAGVFRSTDGGASWSQRRTGFFYEVVVNPQDGDVIYACPGVCKSTDAGDTWNCYSEGMTDTNVVSLAIAASSPNVLFAGSF